MNRKTIFSPDRLYRYTLWREFYAVKASNPPLLPVEGNQAHNFVQFIGLNPSTADETLDDPTIRRCIGFAKAWGYGAMCMTNLFAWRDTDPEKMKRSLDAVGGENDTWLKRIYHHSGIAIAAWGKHGSFQGRGEFVKNLLQKSEAFPKLHYLALNNDGSPKHPLYLPKTLTPLPL
jgi:hypothetical protein